uniref:UDENN FLCN/SMCR8-type domain-containing protein n=1 Tax=Heterorhabditis bacteriophora TaxID=37862 RepID=A0A1I7XH46_HETBA
MSMVLMPEDLLIRNNRVIDPFNRLGCNINPILIVVEFCQVEGPRPLTTVHYKSASSVSTIDIDSLAVWLMSSETENGTIHLIYNQQMGIYAFSYYMTVYDIRARAFQRPLCIAFLYPNKPSGKQLTRFSASVRRLISPLIMCNRRLFLRQISDVIKISDAIENDTVQSYYSLDPDTLKSTSKNPKMAYIADQKYSHVIGLVDSECCGHREEDRHAAEETFLSFRTPAPLKPIKDLVPCTYDRFMASLHPLLSYLCEHKTRKGVLYSVGMPILRFSKYESPMKEKNLLYPVLAGDNMIVCGSEQRKRTVVDLVHKMNLLKPKAHTNYEVILWADSKESYQNGVTGLCCSRTQSMSLSHPNVTVLDTNSSVLRIVPYQGNLLANLRIKRKFPTDNSLLKYLSASLADLCSVVYISRFLSPLNLTEEDLSFDDERIIVNLLTEIDLMKYQGLKCAIDKRKPFNAPVKIIQL